MGSKLSSGPGGRLSPRTRALVLSRRRAFLWWSFIIPMFAGLVTIPLDRHKICEGIPWSSDRCKGNFLLLGAATFMIPCFVSFVAIYSLDSIHGVSSRPTNKSSAGLSLLFFLCSILMSVFVSIVDPSPYVGIIISCSYMISGWLFEASLGLATQIGLVASSNCLAVGFVKAIVKSHHFNPVYWLWILPPVFLSSTLNLMTWTGYQRGLFPVDIPAPAQAGGGVQIPRM